MAKTGINWAEFVWNPVRGCSRVSEGCRNCYAEQAAGAVLRKQGDARSKRGVMVPTSYSGLVELRGGEWRWTGRVAFDATKLAEPLERRKPTTYFVNSMSDLFHDGFTDEQIAAVFGVMAATPQHTFIVLTKRAQRMQAWFEWQHEEPQWAALRCQEAAIQHGAWISLLDPAGYSKLGWPLPNVILGVSVENQATADERIPHLLATPAAVRAISAEPLLGPLDVAKYMWPVHWSWDSRYATPQDALAAGARAEKRRQALVSAPAAFLDWVVTGCESGPNARPCEVDWLRSLRDQCVQFGTPFWLKQARADELGHGCVIENGKMLPLPLTAGHGSERKPGGIIDLPYLDGVQWAQRPEVRR